MPRGRKPKTKTKTKSKLPMKSVIPPQKLDFKFTGKVTPEMISKAGKTAVQIFFKIDDALYKAIKKANPGKSGAADYIETAVQNEINDLDNVLLAVMEETARQKDYPISATGVKLNVSIAALLLDAKDFLASKGYKRITLGKLAVACALLQADKGKEIPPFEQEQQELHPTT